MGNITANYTVPTDCSSAIPYTKDFFINFIQAAQIILTVISLVLIYHNASCFFKKRKTIHINFLLIIFSAFLFYGLHSIDILAFNLVKQLQYRFMSDPCALYTLNLDCFIYRIICYLALLGFSLVHLCLCLERFLAIFYVKTYEKMGPKIGILMIIFMWVVIIGGLAYLFVDSSDTNFWAYYSYCSVLSNWTSGRILGVFYFLLVLNILVSIADFFLLKLNDFKKYNNKIGVLVYDLSKKFQLNENSFTIKMIIPFAITHSIMFTFYLAASLAINKISQGITDKVMQKVAIEGAYLLNSVYIFTMMVVIKIVNSQKQQNQPTIVKTNQTDLYFKMFNTQIAGPLRISNVNITK